MRSAVYIRVSSEEQAEHGYSLEDQRETCIKHAQDLGASSIQVFADEGVSGSTLERPALEELRRKVRAGTFDLLIIRDPDRLSRRLAHQLLLTEEFETAGVQLVFVDFEWEDTPEGRLFYNLRGAIAEYEREKIRQRMIRGRFQKAKQGGFPMGFTAYGYDYDVNAGTVSINTQEAKVVKEIFRFFLKGDRGINGIAKLLNQQCIPTKKGTKNWHRTVVWQILNNAETYAGTWQYGKTMWDGKQLVKVRPPDERIAVPVPAIIDSQTASLALSKLEESRRLWAGRPKRQYLLSGIITCGDCGNTVTGVFSKWWGKRDRYYTCRKNYQGAKHQGCRPARLIPAGLLEETIWTKIKEWLNDPVKLLKEVQRVDQDQTQVKDTLLELKQRIQEVEKGQENVLNALAFGLLELNNKTTAALRDLKNRKARLLRQYDDLENKLYKQHLSLTYLQTISKEVLGSLDEIDFARKKAIVRSLIKQIIVTRKDSNWHATVVTSFAYTDIVIGH
jgi:site-specific DNA recombinase